MHTAYKSPDKSQYFNAALIAIFTASCMPLMTSLQRPTPSSLTKSSQAIVTKGLHPARLLEVSMIALGPV